MHSAPEPKSAPEKAASSFPKERRVVVRLRPPSLIYIILEAGNGGIALNLSDSGMAIQAVAPIIEDFLPHLRFQLPTSRDWIETAGRVIWTNETKKLVGIRFEEIPESSRQLIRKWAQSQGTAPDVAAPKPLATDSRSVAAPFP